MAIDTAPALTPMADWDEDAFASFTTPMHGAGVVAYVVMAHSEAFGPSMARLAALGEAGQPEGFEDWHDFLWSFATEAGQLGYVISQIPTGGFDLPWEEGRLRTGDMARAVAALTRTDVVETEQPFDPDWAEKRAAADEEARKARLAS